MGGTLRVASFNLLNFFTTLSEEGEVCGAGENLECRGADTAEEFERQRAKIIEALLGLDADVVGLVELENTPGADPLGQPRGGPQRAARRGHLPNHRHRHAWRRRHPGGPPLQSGRGRSRGRDRCAFPTGEYFHRPRNEPGTAGAVFCDSYGGRADGGL